MTSIICLSQHSFEDLLNLEAFACEKEVLVHFAPVNKYGISSRYTKAEYLDIYGGKLEEEEEEKKDVCSTFLEQ